MGNKKIGEADLVIPALKIINETPGITTSTLITELEKNMILSDSDREILKGRDDTKFSQIVRNLNAHYDTNDFGKYTTKGIGRNGGFFINEEGKRRLKKLRIEKEEDELIDFNFQKDVTQTETYSKEKLSVWNNRTPKLNAPSLYVNKYITDARITKTVLTLRDFKCEIDQNHISFITRSNNPYMEGHHLIPMKAQEDFININIDRSNNICCLCPNCHKALHLGNRDEQTRRLFHLYKEKRKDLESVGIEILFEELLYKYYI